MGTFEIVDFMDISTPYGMIYDTWKVYSPFNEDGIYIYWKFGIGLVKWEDAFYNMGIELVGYNIQNTWIQPSQNTGIISANDSTNLEIYFYV